MFPSPMTFRFIEDERGGGWRISQTYMGGSLSPEPHPECFSPFGIQTHWKIFWIANCILECSWLFNRELQTANCILKTNCLYRQFLKCCVKRHLNKLQPIKTKSSFYHLLVVVKFHVSNHNENWLEVTFKDR